MAGLFTAFTHLISGRPWSDLPSSFNYVIENEVPLSYPTLFSLHSGTNRSTGDKVSIFIHTKKKKSNASVSQKNAFDHGDDTILLARNCLKHMRAIRHPHILRVHEALEVPSGVYIVTEAVTPLCLTEVFSDPTWGIYEIASAVHFLNASCKAVHNIVCPFSVFVTQSDGRWRLGSFEALVLNKEGTANGGVADTVPVDAERHPLYTSGTLQPPVATSGTALVDRWGLALTLGWVYAFAKKIPSVTTGATLEPDALLRHCPDKAQNLCKNWLVSISKANRTQRTAGTSDKYLDRCLKEHPYFIESPLVEVMLFFDQINLKSNWEKEVFFSKLSDTLCKLPFEVLCQQILPQLLFQFEFLQQPSLILPSVFYIAEKALQEELNSVEPFTSAFHQHIVPVLLKLFKYRDRATRYALLQKGESFVAHFTDKDVADIFDAVCMGLSDSFVPLREATLRSMVLLVPKLGPTPAVGTAIQRICRIAREDTEGVMRTNAIVCLAKLCPLFSDKPELSQIVGTTLLRGFKDVFPACRLAALRALGVCLTQDTLPVNDLMTRFAPALCHACVETDVALRQVAFAILDQLLAVARSQLDTLATASSEISVVNTPAAEGRVVGAEDAPGGWEKSRGIAPPSAPGQATETFIRFPKAPKTRDSGTETSKVPGFRASDSPSRQGLDFYGAHSSNVPNAPAAVPEGSIRFSTGQARGAPAEKPTDGPASFEAESGDDIDPFFDMIDEDPSYFMNNLEEARSTPTLSTPSADRTGLRNGTNTLHPSASSSTGSTTAKSGKPQERSKWGNNASSEAPEPLLPVARLGAKQQPLSLSKDDDFWSTLQDSGDVSQESKVQSLKDIIQAQKQKKKHDTQSSSLGSSYVF